MIEEREGWFVVNVARAHWHGHPQFGLRCSFEGEGRFPQVGVGLAVLEPGNPNCRYHRESAQEDFLVLSGTCLLIANGEERELSAWDFVHCPPGTSHVFVGTGDGPCVLLMLGARFPGLELFYPACELARRHGAEAPEPTADPRVAYADVTRPQPCEAAPWPLA